MDRGRRARATSPSSIGELLDAPHGYLLPFEALAKALQGGKPPPHATAIRPAGSATARSIAATASSRPPTPPAIARRRLLPLVERMHGDHGFEVGA